MLHTHKRITFSLLLTVAVFGFAYHASALPQQPITNPASNPSPANGATNVSPNALLDWASDPNATDFDVYFGSCPSPSYVATGYKQGQGQLPVMPTYNPSLTFGTTYCWSITSRNSVDSAPGPAWQFTTQPAPPPPPPAVFPGSSGAPGLSEPTQGPPNQNVSAPLTTGSAYEAKSGRIGFADDLWVNYNKSLLAMNAAGVFTPVIAFNTAAGGSLYTSNPSGLFHIRDYNGGTSIARFSNQGLTFTDATPAATAAGTITGRNTGNLDITGTGNVRISSGSGGSNSITLTGSVISLNPVSMSSPLYLNSRDVRLPAGAKITLGTNQVQSYSGAQPYRGATVANYDGRMNQGAGSGGYDVANNACATQFTGSRMCNAQDLALFYSPGVTSTSTFPSGGGWYSTFQRSLITPSTGGAPFGSPAEYVNDCKGWKSGGPAASDRGPLWLPSGEPSDDSCSATHKVLCCGY